MRIAVTGATGLLGRATCQAVLDAGHELMATDRARVTAAGRRQRPPDYPIAVADLRDRIGCYPLFEGCDAVIHCGNHPNGYMLDAQTVFAENCAMNVNVFQAAIEQGARRVVFASSIQAATPFRCVDDGVASRLPYLPIDGELPAAPYNAYGASKVAAESLLSALAQQDPELHLVAIRYPWILSHSIRARDSVDAEYYNIDEAFSFMSGDQAASLAVAAATASPAGYRCYQGGCDEAWLDRPLAELVAEYYSGVPLRRELAELTSLVDVAVLERELGWRPEPIDWSRYRIYGRA